MYTDPRSAAMDHTRFMTMRCLVMDRTRFPSARVMEDDSDLTEMECVGWRERAQLVVSVSFQCPTPRA